MSKEDIKVSISPYLEVGVSDLEVLLNLSSHPVRLAKLDLHVVEVALHLLLDPQGLIAAAGLSIQGSLKRVHRPQVIPLGLLHLLILLGQLALNFGLDLVELQLGSEDLAFFMFQRGLEGLG